MDTAAGAPGEVVALIPARGGSKGIPRKNLREVGGSTLLQRAIDCAMAARMVTRTVVTTDDDEIAARSEEVGCEVVRRPTEMAEDTSPVIDAVRHARDVLVGGGAAVDAIVLVQPTSPLRVPDDVDGCLDLLFERSLDGVATFTEASLNPHHAWKLEDHHPTPFIEGVDPWVRRQDLPEAYELNGAVYAFRPWVLDVAGPGILKGRTAGLAMPRERSLDIDDEIDLALAELLVRGV